MDIEPWLINRDLDGRFPLPLDRPFTARTAYAAGLSKNHLTELTRVGLLTRPIKGVYLPADVPDSPATRIKCLKLVAPEDAVITDRHAGWVHGAQMILAPGEHLAARPISLFLPAGSGRRLRNQFADSGERTLSPSDVTEIDGLQVTTRLRTALDLGRVRWPEEAICGIDSMFRLGGLEHGEFLAGIPRFRGMRWVTTLRAVGPLADGRSESPGESVLRLRCVEAGVRVTPQVEVWSNGVLLARLDLGDEEEKLAFEYDGAEWHSSPEQMAHDRRRRAEVGSEGWLVEAFTKEQLFGRLGDADQRIRAAAQQARRRRTLRIVS